MSFLRTKQAKAYTLLGLSLLISVLMVPLDPFISVTDSNLLPQAVKMVSWFFSDHGLKVFYGVFALLLIGSWVKKDIRYRRYFWIYFKAELLFAGVVVRVMKALFGRARPKYGHEFTFFSTDPHYNAFPSGHSADAFIGGIVLYFLLSQSSYSRWRYVPVMFAALIAASRVLTGAHQPSDVIAGSAIGVFGAWFFISREKQLTVNDI